MKISHYKIFISSVIITLILVMVKFAFHQFGIEIIALDRLHSSVVSGTIFVIGFLLSATIKDYKEAERIPAEAAAAIENIYEDAISLKENYPDFNLLEYKEQLRKVTNTLTADLKNSSSHVAKQQLHELSRLSAKMEKAGIPANFITKIKQQQAVLVRHLFRVNYIQRITFIPSASTLAWSIVSLTSILILFTKMETFIGGMIVSGAIFFILIYVLSLIEVIKTPFQDTGKTKDDVSLFLLKRTAKYLEPDEQ